jgi:multicomponent Na+:H+ antiporter subunit G
MSQTLNMLSGLLLFLGALFILVGSIGLLRMPDVFTRMHAAGITDTIGAAAIILGLMLVAGWTIVLIKLLVVLLFLMLLNPTASHALARAAVHGIRSPWQGESEQR